ncbi:MAG: choice-of-anchor tandem repeat GloVer-containing protein, partial [Terriglobia bacterium]
YFYGTSSKIAYKIAPSGIYTSLGSIPGVSVAPLLQATDGNFYGTTYNGGSSNDGTVFKMTPDGTVTTVSNFDSTHGSAPTAPLIQASDGNFYGTTAQGGSNKQGVAFRLTPQGVLTVLHNFPDPNYPNDGSELYAGLVQASDGNLYGVTAVSKAGPGCGVFFEITLAGGYSTLYTFDCTDGSTPLSTPMQHTNGTIYGLTDYGGPDNDGVLYSFNVGLPPFTKLMPTAGKVGRVIDILGQGFTGTTSVSFNGTAATFQVESDTFLKAIVPSGATTGVVTVTTPSGTLSSNQPFRVTQ